MKYMKTGYSNVMEEFGRLMQETDRLKKTAQAQTPEQQARDVTLAKLLSKPDRVTTDELNRLYSATNLADYTALKGRVRAAQTALMGDTQLDVKPILRGESAPVAAAPATVPKESLAPASKKPVAPVQKGGAALSSRQKTAEQKLYDVTPKEDIIHTAHPKTAVVCGETVENLNEQHKADRDIAEKEPQLRKTLASLIQLTKTLKAENNLVAYKLVKATIMDLAKPLMKKAGRGSGEGWGDLSNLFDEKLVLEDVEDDTSGKGRSEEAQEDEGVPGLEELTPGIETLDSKTELTEEEEAAKEAEETRAARVQKIRDRVKALRSKSTVDALAKKEEPEEDGDEEEESNVDDSSEQVEITGAEGLKQKAKEDPGFMDKIFTVIKDHPELLKLLLAAI